jgi:hypothetical protein
MSPPRDPAQYMRERRARLSDHLRQRLQLGDHLKRNYGLTLAQYDDLLRSQEGQCAVCQRSPKPGQRLVVDHDHHTGAVRGLLCSSCNTALGLMEENPLLLQDLAAYAEHCVQSRDGFTADPTDQERRAIAVAFERKPNTPYLVNAFRESLLRLYAPRPKAVKTKIRSLARYLPGEGI